MDLKDFKKLFQEFKFNIASDYFSCDDSASYLVDHYFENGYHLSFDMYGTFRQWKTSEGDWMSPPDWEQECTIEIDEIVLIDANEDNIDITPEIEQEIKNKVEGFFFAEVC